METILETLTENYLNVTLACVIIGYLITTTPYLSRLKDFVPILVTIAGSLLGIVLHGLSVDVVVYGALAGILSTGLYELFGKGIKNLGEIIGRRSGLKRTQDDDPFDNL